MKIIIDISKQAIESSGLNNSVISRFAKFLLMDALYEFQRVREPAEEYVESRYPNKTSWEKDIKASEVQERINMAYLLHSSSIEIINDSIFTFYWMNGRKEQLKGKDAIEALNNKGYNRKDLVNLDFDATFDANKNEYIWNNIKNQWCIV